MLPLRNKAFVVMGAQQKSGEPELRPARTSLAMTMTSARSCTSAIAARRAAPKSASGIGAVIKASDRPTFCHRLRWARRAWLNG